MIVYLQGSLSSDGQHILCPLSSSALVFIIRYCQTTKFELVFISDSSTHTGDCFTLARSVLSDLNVNFEELSEVPKLSRNVSLPALYQPELSLVRSGLCVLLRHIIREAHISAPHLHLIDLLGFRQGSMKMCSEVSGFTKLCEVELPQSISHLIQHTFKSHNTKAAEDNTEAREIVLPSALMKLDCHFRKRCIVHNDNKKRREELSKMKHMFESFRNQNFNSNSGKHVGTQNENGLLIQNYKADSNMENDKPFYSDHLKPSRHSMQINSANESFRVEVETLSSNEARLQVDYMTHLHHGVRRLKVDKTFDSLLCMTDGNKAAHEEKTDASPTIEQYNNSVNGYTFRPDTAASAAASISELVDKLTFLDIKYEHTYSEGIEMTLADLILYVYVYYLLEAVGFSCGASLTDHIPSILPWASHMTSLPAIVNAGQLMGWNMSSLAACFNAGSKVAGPQNVVFIKEVVEVEDEDDEMELSRCARMKHKAIKPEVTQALQKFEKANIKPVTGSHPCGDEVEIDWANLPVGIHPREGDVPEKRTQRKCQQLENLVTAVQKIAQPGNIIVDFCTGGGHLGIALAYLLPECQVYLVENKEESLLKACSRLESLGVRNVTMYQCNLDYFTGQFDIGVCLHACGSATDMVLQLCLKFHASFVICPCCYGSIQKTHLLSYPQSQQFIQANITYKDFLTLGHAADQTEFNIALEEQGRCCMNLVDTDRAELAREHGYDVTLCLLKPQSCTPKNNLLIGMLNTKCISKHTHSN